MERRSEAKTVSTRPYSLFSYFSRFSTFSNKSEDVDGYHQSTRTKEYGATPRMIVYPPPPSTLDKQHRTPETPQDENLTQIELETELKVKEDEEKSKMEVETLYKNTPAIKALSELGMPEPRSYLAGESTDIDESGLPENLSDYEGTMKTNKKRRDSGFQQKKLSFGPLFFCILFVLVVSVSLGIIFGLGILENEKDVSTDPPVEEELFFSLEELEILGQNVCSQIAPAPSASPETGYCINSTHRGRCTAGSGVLFFFSPCASGRECVCIPFQRVLDANPCGGPLDACVPVFE